LLFDQILRPFPESRIGWWAAVLILATTGGSLEASAQDPIASVHPHPNSRAACRVRESIPDRFLSTGPPFGGRPGTVPEPDGLKVVDLGAQLRVEGAEVLALVSSPVGGRGGGVIEGVTHRVSAGDLIGSGLVRSDGRAWEICLGSPRTDPDTCGRDGMWIDSRTMPSKARIERTTAGNVLRFTWVDEVRGLSVQQDVLPVQDGLHLRLSATATGLEKGLVAARFPILAIDYRERGGSPGELVIPRGNLGIQCRDCRFFGAMYPGIYQTMPWFGVLKGSAGLYVGAHDPKGSMKRVVVSGPQAPGYSYFEIYPEASGAIGNSIEPDWPVDVAPVCAKRGWPALAHRYKEWVGANTEWGRAPLLRNRSDLPIDLREGAWWFVHSIVPDGGIDLLEQSTDRFRKDFPNLPTIHHWYEWHKPGMDRGFPDHWPKPGTKEAIGRLQANPKTRILLYTNATHSDQSTAPVESGRPRCANGASQYPRYWHETSQRADGKRVYLVPSSQACLAAMDLSSEGWRSVVLSNSDQVTRRLGAAGVYLDVLGNVIDGSWFPARHPAGRGEWVTRSARELLRAVSNRPELVVVEGALEQMTGISSAGVNYLGSTVDMVPLFPLVYHERFILAGMASLEPDDRDALRMKNGLAFSWGLQMGLNSLQWYESHGKSNIAWANKLLRARHRFSNWLAYGEYLGPVSVVGASAAEGVESKTWAAFIDDRPPVSFRRNPIEANLYKGADERYSLILVNLSERTATATVELPAPFENASISLVSASGVESRDTEIQSVGGKVAVRLEGGDIVRGELILQAEAGSAHLEGDSPNAAHLSARETGTQ